MKQFSLALVLKQLLRASQANSKQSSRKCLVPKMAPALVSTKAKIMLTNSDTEQQRQQQFYKAFNILYDQRNKNIVLKSLYTILHIFKQVLFGAGNQKLETASLGLTQPKNISGRRKVEKSVITTQNKNQDSQLQHLLSALLLWFKLVYVPPGQSNIKVPYT